MFNRYLDRLADSLQQKLKVSEKLVTSIKTMADKRQAASMEQQDLEPKLEIIRMKTKELQLQVLSLMTLHRLLMSLLLQHRRILNSLKFCLTSQDEKKAGHQTVFKSLIRFQF